MIKIPLKQSCCGLDSCSFVTAAGWLWQRISQRLLRARSWRKGKGSSTGLLPSPAHLPPVAAQFVSSPAHACIQGELVVADACAGCMGSGECVHLNLKVYGMLCFVFFSWIIAYGIHLLYLLTVDCVWCLKTHRVWSQGSSICILRWGEGLWSYFELQISLIKSS